MVGWLSGLKQQFAKLSYSKEYRGFESPSNRQASLNFSVNKVLWGRTGFDSIADE